MVLFVWLVFLGSQETLYLHGPRVHGAKWGGMHLSFCVFVGHLFVGVLFGTEGRISFKADSCVRLASVIFVFGLWVLAFLKVGKVPFEVVNSVFEALNLSVPVCLFVCLASHDHTYLMYHGKGRLVPQYRSSGTGFEWRC